MTKIDSIESWICESRSGSTAKCHGSATLPLRRWILLNLSALLEIKVRNEDSDLQRQFTF
jgi:hypothetical protein